MPPAAEQSVSTRVPAAALLLKSLRRLGISLLLVMGVLFSASGDVRWPMAWAYVAIILCGFALTTVVIARKHPDLLNERSQIGEGLKSWDKLLAMLMGLVIPLSTLLVAGLDRRWRWSAVPLPLQIAGLMLFLVGTLIVMWAMASNRFFAPVVRIQKDRGHTVATAGPYRFVRHPGYVGMALCGIALPLMLGSLLGLVPAGFGLVVTVVRTAWEDQTLRQELEGYEEYASRVRFRLIPGIW